VAIKAASVGGLFHLKAFASVRLLITKIHRQLGGLADPRIILIELCLEVVPIIAEPHRGDDCTKPILNTILRFRLMGSRKSLT
jgi:hypothetical protein